MRARLMVAFWILLPWAGLFIALLPTWEGGVYYGYGHFVPFLGWLLVYARILHPAPDTGKPLRLSPLWWGSVVLGLAICAAGGILEGLDPLWRRALWFHGAGCFILSAATLYALGGWRWIAMATGCGLFLLTALPLPFFIEFPLVARLTSVVADAAAYGLNNLGIPVVASGSVLMGNSHVVGVEDTCSGLRSIQAGIMLSLLFGEWYRLHVWKRVALVVLTLAVSVFVNVIRVIWLAREGLSGTGEIAAAMHDLSGALSFSVTVVVILFLTLWLAGRRKREHAEWLPSLRRSDVIRPLVIGLFATILPFGAALAWFGFSQAFPASGPNLKLPAETLGRVLRTDPAKTPASRLLHYDRAQMARYVLNREEWLDLVVLDYAADNSRSWSDLLVHGPEICMPSLGLQSGTVLEKGETVLNGQPWQIEKFRFTEPRSGKTIYVFRLVWWGGGEIATQQHLQARWNALRNHHRINWTTRLVLGAVVLNDADEPRAYSIFLNAVQDALSSKRN